MMGRFLEHFLIHPLARGLDLESADAATIHLRLIQEKPFLNRLYRHYYADFLKAHHRAPIGARIEVGSGGGFLNALIPGLIRVDLRPGAQVNVTASADALPFADASAGAVFLLNTLHHLSNPARFLDEASRVLRPGGRCVVIEPFVSLLSRYVYRHLHHEPFAPDAPSWNARAHGLQGGANLALPWILFYRDRRRFEARFPTLHIASRKPHTIFSYLLSGGVSRKALLPGVFFGPVARLENLLQPLAPQLCMMMTVDLIRNPSSS
ncbi:MAG: class I SAM-dependent methyltransferase [Deltaproteobacteria bacterium]|nr:class I SAM-dependent methyltransferase [Deltaproteobacteria bacterium]MBW2041942.1 class I SAM-dependent methyltransferase [Deltaproteobacteria bacterium]MBW2133344.1 class I SAM-dependent methyltransferase [Deltaproteobacteria bacterium]